MISKQTIYFLIPLMVLGGCSVASFSDPIICPNGEFVSGFNSSGNGTYTVYCGAANVSNISNVVTLDGVQTITGHKTFTSDIDTTGFVVSKTGASGSALFARTDNGGAMAMGGGVSKLSAINFDNTGIFNILSGTRANVENKLLNSGVVRLSVDGATGNIAIGTTNANQRVQVIGNINVSGTVYYGALQANSPHAFLNDETGYTRICKMATNSVVVMETIELVNGKYVKVYTPNSPDCNKEVLSELMTHEQEFDKKRVSLIEERTYTNVWTKQERTETINRGLITRELVEEGIEDLIK